MAARLGLRAATINSGNAGEWRRSRNASADGIDVLDLPERLGERGLREPDLPSIQGAIGLLVIDEAHCISDWGHDFRPDYRRIGRLLPLLGPDVPVLATTATANNRVVEDVAAQLGEGVAIIRGPLGRDTLRLDAIALSDGAERLAWLAENLPRLPGSGIVYCLTVADTERVAAWLQTRGIDARAYTGPMDTGAREVLEDALLSNDEGARRDGRAGDGLRGRPGSSSTTSGRGRRSRTTSRSAGLGERSTVRTASCWPAGRTTRSPTTSCGPRSRRPSGCATSSPRSRRSTRQPSARCSGRST
jgi:hypothetical protein